MGLISGNVGRRSRESKRYIAGIYTLLIVGGITMIYPFLIMISGSFKSDVDVRDYDILPKYFYSDTVLFRKYLEGKYDESVALYNSNARQDEYSFEKIAPPTAVHPGAVADWNAFLGAHRPPGTWTLLGHSYSVNNRMYPILARRWRSWIVQRCHGSVAEYNTRFASLMTSWLTVQYPAPISPADRVFKLAGSPLQLEAIAFQAEQPVRDLVVTSLDGRYITDFLMLKYGKEIADYNKVHGTAWKSWDDVALPVSVPAGGAARADWLEFVRNELNLQFVDVTPAAHGAYAAWLERRYDGSLPTLNRAYAAHYASFGAVPYPADRVTVSSKLVDWELFVREADPGSLRVVGPDPAWRAWLKAKYRNNLADLNQAHGAAWRSFDAVPIPAKEADWADMKSRRLSLRWEFLTRNYRHVIEYLVLHGRGVWNTFIFCFLSIASVIIVNPLAAYAMSRYQLPSAYKVLLFLLATAAFPPMVTAIPNFLLLKELGLLNTFWALVLPGMVNGFSIFLLKGFFDSLPKELYEAAQLDGAGEWTMFWGLTMHLSKPILAVITLDAFNAAYGAFVFAFIVCQDEKMWTLMVWLYQLQQYAHQSVTFAALLIASVPTFLVFLLAQKLILEGIVIPTEK